MLEIVVIFILVFLVSYVCLIAWIWRDAREINESAVGWAFAAAICWVLILPIYLSAKKKRSQLYKISQSNAPTNSTMNVIKSESDPDDRKG